MLTSGCKSSFRGLFRASLKLGFRPGQYSHSGDRSWNQPLVGPLQSPVRMFLSDAALGGSFRRTESQVSFLQ